MNKMNNYNKTETDSQIQRTNRWLIEWRGVGEEEKWVGGIKIQTSVAKYTSQVRNQSVRNTVNGYVISFYSEYHSLIYCSDYFEVYGSTESLCSVIGANIVLQVNYTSKTNKQAYRNRNSICGHQKRGMGGGGIG